MVFCMESASMLVEASFFHNIGQTWKSAEDLFGESKTFLPLERNGCCQFWNEEDKYWVQPVDPCNNIFTGKALQIARPSDSVLSQTALESAIFNTVVGINDKFYLLKNTNAGYNKPIVPYNKINHAIPTFYSTEDQQCKLILPKNKFANSENTHDFSGESVLQGILREHFGNRLLIDIYKESAHTETISMVVEGSVYASITTALKQTPDKPVFAVYRVNNSEQLVIIKITQDTNQLAEKTDPTENIITQISHHQYEPKELRSWQEIQRYPAISSKYVGENIKRNSIYQIKFNVAGILFTRFVAASYPGAKVRIEIKDIIPDALVTFTTPREKPALLTALEYIANKKNKKTKDTHSPTKNLKDIINNLLGYKIEKTQDLSFRVLNESDINKLFLPTFKGYFDTTSDEPIIHITQNDETISLELEKNKSDDNIKNYTKYIALKGVNGGAVLIVERIEKGTPTTTDQPQSAETGPDIFPQKPFISAEKRFEQFKHFTQFLRNHPFHIAGGFLGLGVGAFLLYYFMHSPTTTN